jgi:hypothetical protein
MRKAWLSRKLVVAGIEALMLFARRRVEPGGDNWGKCPQAQDGRGHNEVRGDGAG